MSVAKSISAAKDSVKDAIAPASCARSYGFSSWCYFAMVVAVSLGFLITQIVVNGVRSGSISATGLDEALFPGVYWTIATAGMIFLSLSALFLGLSVALLVVRAWMHAVPCRAYGWMLLIQVCPWLYFASAF